MHSLLGSADSTVTNKTYSPKLPAEAILSNQDQNRGWYSVADRNLQPPWGPHTPLSCRRHTHTMWNVLPLFALPYKEKLSPFYCILSPPLWGIKVTVKGINLAVLNEKGLKFQILFHLSTIFSCSPSSEKFFHYHNPHHCLHVSKPHIKIKCVH